MTLFSINNLEFLATILAKCYRNPVNMKYHTLFCIIIFPSFNCFKFLYKEILMDLVKRSIKLFYIVTDFLDKDFLHSANKVVNCFVLN